MSKAPPKDCEDLPGDEGYKDCEGNPLPQGYRRVRSNCYPGTHLHGEFYYECPGNVTLWRGDRKLPPSIDPVLRGFRP